MRLERSLPVLLSMLVAVQAQAAVKEVPVSYQQAILQDGMLLHEARRQTYGFKVEILGDGEGVKDETLKDGRPFVRAEKGQDYSVRLTNPLPVRVAVNLTVDGLNSITGKPSGIADGEKWIIDPYGTVTIPGWQVSDDTARRFFFTDKPKSYAKWRGDKLKEDLSANCGVIGAAFFWDQAELDRYWDDHPLYRVTRRPFPCAENDAKKDSIRLGPLSSAAGAGERDEESPAAPEQQAGTGMGEKESNLTYEVAFDYDRGMYSVDQAVVIYYDFADPPKPNPFPGLAFAPEMP